MYFLETPKNKNIPNIPLRYLNFRFFDEGLFRFNISEGEKGKDGKWF